MEVGTNFSKFLIQSHTWKTQLRVENEFKSYDDQVERYPQQVTL